MGPKHSLHGLLAVAVIGIVLTSGCTRQEATPPEVPHDGRWGIYGLDLESGNVSLIYSSHAKVSNLALDRSGERFAFSQQLDGSGDDKDEIVTLNTDGTGFKRLTENDYMDTYPSWSPDGTKIAYLSFRDTLDIYVMNADGADSRELFDSGLHDGDIDWGDGTIVFTMNSSIWRMNADGAGQERVTHPPMAGEWGSANLPFGDYDPRLNPDGTKVVFERLEDDMSPHGNYDIFVIGIDGTGETRLTDTGYSQGLASWSHSGDRIVYIVAAMDTEGKYDMYMMNADGTENADITPEYFPADFIIHSAVFSAEDTKLYFLGEWWE